MVRSCPRLIMSHPPRTIVPMMMDIIVTDYYDRSRHYRHRTPLGMDAVPLGMIHMYPVRIVPIPPVGIAPHMVAVVSAHRPRLRMDAGMIMKEQREVGMPGEISRVAHKSRIRRELGMVGEIALEFRFRMYRLRASERRHGDYRA